MFILLLLKPKRKGNASNRPQPGGGGEGMPDSMRSNGVNGDWGPSDGTPFSAVRDV
jgi:hypothetical protein